MILDQEAEEAVLGAVVLSANALPTLIVDEALTPDDFARDRHRSIFAAMLALHDAGEPLDRLTIARKADVDPAEIENLAAFSPSVANVRQHARLVKRAALRRRWHLASNLLAEAAQTDDEQFVAQAEQTLAAPTVTEDTYSPDRLAEEVYAYLDDDRPAGISTGCPELDDIIGGGFRRGDTTVIAAWESMGKSALCDQWLTTASVAGYRTHVYINEMSATDRALRMVARRGAADWSKLVRRTVDGREGERVIASLQRLPFGVTDCSVWTAEQVARHMRVNRWDLCAVDVLHNMPYENEADLRLILTTLAAAARSTGSHLILVCHLNQARARDELLPRPVLRDLRDSGMIQKLAANVLFLHREQTNNGGFIETSPDGLVVADKARHGRRGDGVDVTFLPQRMEFSFPGYTQAWAA